MDYKGINCPVCESQFKENDDIVVCPKCGAPYHRSCYEQTNSCIFTDLHNQNKAWEAPKEAEPFSDTHNESIDKLCPNCQATNPRNSLFCNKCGSSLSPNSGHAPFGSNNHNEKNNPLPFHQAQYPNNINPMTFVIDVMGGYKKEEPVGDNISAGDLFEIVKTNQPYYMTVFHNKQYFGKNKFNFSAFLFSGGWLLYRKINKLGAIFTAIIALCILAETYLTNAIISPMMIETFGSLGIDISSGMSYSNIYTLAEHLLANDPVSALIMCIPLALNIIRLIIMIICGIKANSWYFNECKKKIHAIQTKHKKNTPEYHEFLYKEGGVNTAIAISLLVCSMIIDYAPQLFL